MTQPILIGIGNGTILMMIRVVGGEMVIPAVGTGAAAIPAQILAVGIGAAAIPAQILAVGIGTAAIPAVGIRVDGIRVDQTVVHGK
jgi:hypothetical protein